MPASSIPGYVQGFRFSDDPAYYDSANKRFIDQAGYGDVNGLLITTGTPAFVTDGTSGKRMLTLDNTVQGEFLLPIPWQGCAILVAKPSMGANGTLYPVIIGAVATAGSNGTIRIVRGSASDYRYRMATASAGLTTEVAVTNANTQVAALANSQQTRKGYATKDGVTITESGPVASAANGNGVALGYASGQTQTGFKARFGNLSGTLADTTVMTNTMTIGEMHFFRGNPLVDSLTQVSAFMAELKTAYAIT